ncbi:hypothetical protein BDA96_02G242500 [Sorghum bicolor]|uniref:Uncharacterized protein n=2 Tax=Sorghum bicolor TaxID=4558 RepID=A0A1B6QD08_SORBI|nr:hypothetical protein BDA96_02G242500 [Sorghum bicolor]KXG35807.1 hypothetical protein SORBI_3002G231400 [Sorghum bicolor]
MVRPSAPTALAPAHLYIARAHLVLSLPMAPLLWLRTWRNRAEGASPARGERNRASGHHQVGIEGIIIQRTILPS